MSISSLAAASTMTEVLSLLQGSGPVGKEADQTHTSAASTSKTDNEQIKTMISELQQHLAPTSISINFSTYGDHHEKIAVTVTDKVTGEVIREIPSKELQQLYMQMNELIGTIFNGSV